MTLPYVFGWTEGVRSGFSGPMRSAPTIGASLVQEARTAKAIVAPQHVVGDDVETKSALVLSPFKFQFAIDEGAAVAQMLENTRGYAGHVTYLENAALDSKRVGISQFLGWDGYDVIHVSSHGKTICDQNHCSGVIFTGDSYSNADELLQITEVGVNTARAVGTKGHHFGLSFDFFQDHYPGGLNKAIIFFSACQTIAAGDFNLGLSLIGDSSVYLGWSGPVHSDVAEPAALALYQNLIADGTTVESARSVIGTLGMDHYTSQKGEAVNADLVVAKPENRDLRIREVVTLEHPQSGGELTAGASVQVVGTADDGIADQVPYQVLIEGVEEGQEEMFMVEVMVDSYSSGLQPASAGEPVGEHGRRITGLIPFVDVQSGGQAADMHAHLQLPEGGTSEHHVMVSLSAEPQMMMDEEPDENLAEVWVGKATGVYDSTILSPLVSTVVAQVTFEQVESPSYAPYLKEFHVRKGTMTWTQTGSLPLFNSEEVCPYSAGPVEVPISPSDGYIEIDTRTTPNTYTMFGLTTGPEVHVAQNCGDQAFDTEAEGVWVAVYEFGEFFVSSDGNQISGNRSPGSSSWEWDFTRQ